MRELSLGIHGGDRIRVVCGFVLHPMPPAMDSRISVRYQKPLMGNFADRNFLLKLYFEKKKPSTMVSVG